MPTHKHIPKGNMCTHRHICTYVTHLYTHTYTHIWTHIHSHTHEHMHIYKHAHNVYTNIPSINTTLKHIFRHPLT